MSPSVTQIAATEAVCATHTQERQILVLYAETNPGSHLLNSAEFLQVYLDNGDQLLTAVI